MPLKAIKVDLIIHFFKGTRPSNLEVRHVARDQQSNTNLFNLSWVANSNVGVIGHYSAVVLNKDNSTIGTVNIHRNTTSFLIAVDCDVKNPQFYVELVDKCNRRFFSNITGSYIISFCSHKCLWWQLAMNSNTV